MEMMGKTFISKDVKAADENDEKQKKLKADKEEEDTSDDKNWNRQWTEKKSMPSKTGSFHLCNFMGQEDCRVVTTKYRCSF